MSGRHTSDAHERAEEQKIENSLKVSSYLDEVFESIHTGAAPKIHVPNYQKPTRGQIYSEVASENQGMSMDLSSIGNSMSDEQIKTAMNDVHSERNDGEKTFSNTASHSVDNRPRFHISRNQAMAIKKYPTLVEFLGRPEGEKVAREIAGDMNILMAEIISANSKEANDCALICKAEKQNLRQYFQGKDWLCRVTASGPFRGDEAIYYSKDNDVACILRKSESEGKINYSDISEQFNIIYEAEQGKIPEIEKEIIEEKKDVEVVENKESDLKEK